MTKRDIEQWQASSDFTWGRRLNWSWIKRRAAFWRCRHEWMVGSRRGGEKACRKCGTWRWSPLVPYIKGGRDA